MLKYVTFITLSPHVTTINQKQKRSPTEDLKCYFDLYMETFVILWHPSITLFATGGVNYSDDPLHTT